MGKIINKNSRAAWLNCRRWQKELATDLSAQTLSCRRRGKYKPEKIKLEKPYKLTWSIHRHTLTSRDTGKPKEFNSREDAIKEIQMLQAHFKTLGYVIWFANIWHKGKSENIISDSSY